MTANICSICLNGDYMLAVDEIVFLNKLIADQGDLISDRYFQLSLTEKGNEIKHVLRQTHCQVTFKKVDGSIRVMPCTLRPESLPAQVQESSNNQELTAKNTKLPKAENPNTIRVYCLDKKEWRSFRIENVISVKILTLS
jgi:hypothetical protein